MEGETISVPHTWNASDKYQNYRGIAWYGTELFLQELAPVNLLRFGAVYHDADVYINGVHTFRHADSGYTPFSFDATRFLRKGKNRIAVRCSNAPSATALPNKGDFDWADDGGLIRAVEFLQKERRDVKDCRITLLFCNTCRRADAVRSSQSTHRCSLKRRSCRSFPSWIGQGARC